MDYSKTLKELNERRKDVLDKADAIVTLVETEQRGMSADEKKDLDGFKSEAQRLADEIDAVHRAKTSRDEVDALKRYTVPAVVAGETAVEPEKREAPRVEVFENEHRAYQKGDAFGAIVAARIQFQPYEHQKAVQWTRSLYGGESHPCVRAMQQSSFTGGGALIPENFVGEEFIELLRAKAAVRRAGARQVRLTNGSFTTPKLTGGVSGGWIGSEGDNLTTGEATLGQLKLVEKKYGVIVPFSNDLRRNASLDAIRIVRDDLVTASANDEDSAFLKGTGLSGQPKGIYYWIPAAGKGNSAGTTLANVRTDIRTAKQRLNNNNVPATRRAWFLHSRSAEYMGWDLVDGNGNFAFPQMQSDGDVMLGGGTAYRDNNIAITLGGSSNASEIYYVEMSECFIGDSMDMEIEIFNNAVYSQNNTIRSGISRDESALRLIRKTDFGMRHTEAAYVLEAVTYGA